MSELAKHCLLLRLAVGQVVAYPALKEIEAKQVVPELYLYGSRGPVGAH